MTKQTFDGDSSGIFLSRSAGHTVPKIQLAPGERLLDGRFLVEFLLGEGGSATIYSVYDRSMRRSIAIKAVSDSEIARGLLAHEAEVYEYLAGFQGVLDFYGHYEVNEPIPFSFLAMERAYCSVEDWIKRHQNDHRTRLDKGLRCFGEICSKASRLHRAGVVHLDLKPSNVLIAPGGIKFGDLASSIIFGGQSVRISPRSQPILRMATPAYGPPELWDSARHRDIGSKSDCYSLGVLAFQLFHPHCALPFSGEEDELRSKHLYEAAPRLVGVDTQIADVVARCLAKR